MTGGRQTRRLERRHAALAVLTLSAGLLAGCNIVSFAAMAYDEAVPKKIAAQYRGLADKNFAVVATTDRRIEADFPGVVIKVVSDVSERLAKEEGVKAAGYIPPDRVMTYLYSHPNWVVRPMSELAKELKVDRLVFIELTEYRLNEPGNSYIWDGVAAGVVQVFEADSQLPDDPAFDRMVQVKYPDDSNTGPENMKGNEVGSVLVRRFVERASWLFFDHEELRDIKY